MRGFKRVTYFCTPLAYVLCNLTLHHLYFRSSVLEKAKQNVEAAQEKQKADYNKKHANPLTLHARKGKKANWISDGLGLIPS